MSEMTPIIIALVSGYIRREKLECKIFLKKAVSIFSAFFVYNFENSNRTRKLVNRLFRSFFFNMGYRQLKCIAKKNFNNYVYILL